MKYLIVRKEPGCAEFAPFPGSFLYPFHKKVPFDRSTSRNLQNGSYFINKTVRNILYGRYMEEHHMAIVFF